MKILQAAIDIDYHMIHFSKAIVNIIGSQNFNYAVLTSPKVNRMHKGFDDQYENESWIIRPYTDKITYSIFIKWFNEADVVLFSDWTLFTMAETRIKNNKLTFYFSERWWKPPIGKWRLIHPRFILLGFILKRLSKNTYFHYLAQGGYAAEDFRSIGKFENRIWNWGYFTDMTEHNLTTEQIIKRKNSLLNIIFCGRLLKFKRVDTLIKAFSSTIKMNSRCHLTIIGDGPEKKKLHELAFRFLPQCSYDFVPLQSNKIIREAMNNSDIFILPSNGYEGWGAVLNEAMAEGCAVVATRESGGGRAMIDDLENGILFDCGNYQQLGEKLSTLINDEELMNKLKANGKETLKQLWSPEIAANRFLKVCSAIISKTEIPDYSSGPMKCHH